MSKTPSPLTRVIETLIADEAPGSGYFELENAVSSVGESDAIGAIASDVQLLADDSKYSPGQKGALYRYAGLLYLIAIIKSENRRKIGCRFSGEVVEAFEKGLSLGDYECLDRLVEISRDGQGFSKPDSARFTQLKETRTKWRREIWAFYRNAIQQRLVELGFSRLKHRHWLLKTDYGFGAIQFDKGGHPWFLKLILLRTNRLASCTLKDMHSELARFKYIQKQTMCRQIYRDQYHFSILLKMNQRWGDRELRSKTLVDGLEDFAIPILNMSDSDASIFQSLNNERKPEIPPVDLLNQFLNR